MDPEIAEQEHLIEEEEKLLKEEELRLKKKKKFDHAEEFEPSVSDLQMEIKHLEAKADKFLGMESVLNEREQKAKEAKAAFQDARKKAKSMFEAEKVEKPKPIPFDYDKRLPKYRDESLTEHRRRVRAFGPGTERRDEDADTKSSSEIKFSGDVKPIDDDEDWTRHTALSKATYQKTRIKKELEKISQQMKDGKMLKEEVDAWLRVLFRLAQKIKRHREDEEEEKFPKLDIEDMVSGLGSINNYQDLHAGTVKDMRTLLGDLNAVIEKGVSIADIEDQLGILKMSVQISKGAGEYRDGHADNFDDGSFHDVDKEDEQWLQLDKAMSEAQEMEELRRHWRVLRTELRAARVDEAMDDERAMPEDRETLEEEVARLKAAQQEGDLEPTLPEELQSRRPTRADASIFQVLASGGQTLGQAGASKRIDAVTQEVRRVAAAIRAVEAEIAQHGESFDGLSGKLRDHENIGKEVEKMRQLEIEAAKQYRERDRDWAHSELKRLSKKHARFKELYKTTTQKFQRAKNWKKELEGQQALTLLSAAAQEANDVDAAHGYSGTKFGSSSGKNQYIEAFTDALNRHLEISNINIKQMMSNLGDGDPRHNAGWALFAQGVGGTAAQPIAMILKKRKQCDHFEGCVDLTERNKLQKEDLMKELGLRFWSHLYQQDPSTSLHFGDL